MRHRERADIQHYAVMISDEDGPLGTALTDLAVPWQRITRGRMRNPIALRRVCRGIKRVIREFEVNAVLANSPQGFLYARCAALGYRVPVAVYYMSVPKPRFWSNNLFDIFTVLARPAAIFAASDEIRHLLQRWGLSNVETVHHGTALQPTQAVELAEVERILKQHSVSSTDPLILVAGRLQTWKGQHVLVGALPEVLKKFPSAHAVVLGGTLFGLETDYPDRIQQQIVDLSIERQVHIVGHHPIRGWLERATLVVHCSIEPDPFPNVCIEALAARRPLITNKLSGTREILSHRQDALIVEPNDQSALAKAIIEVLDSPANAQRLAEAGYQRYLATCTPSSMVQPIEATLTRIACGPAVTGSRA
jgi:glycosyltransferase involved in cell wall biosynthesis